MTTTRRSVRALLLGIVVGVVASVMPASAAAADWTQSSIPDAQTTGYPLATTTFAGEVHVFGPGIGGAGIFHSAAGSRWVSHTIDPEGSTGQDVTWALWYGQLHLFNKPKTGSGVRHVVWTGTQWVASTLDIGGSDGTGLATYVGYYGEFHVFGRRAAGSGLRHLVYSPGGQWHAQDLDMEASGRRAALTVIAGELHVFDGVTAGSGGVRHLVYSPSQRRWVKETFDAGQADGNTGLGYVHIYGEMHVFAGRLGTSGIRHLVYAGAWLGQDLDTGPTGSSGSDTAVTPFGGGLHVFTRPADGQGLRHTWYELIRGWQYETIDPSGTSGRGIALSVRGSVLDVFSAGNGGGVRRNSFDRAAAVWGGIGAWVDRYDYPSADPPGLDVMASNGVATLYLQTGRSSEAADVLEPDRLSRIVEGAHDRGIKVVGWYAPSFLDYDLDLRRSIAGAQFRTNRGDFLDGFAPDIESTKLTDHAERSRRLVVYSQQLRAATAGMPLGAIVPSPLGFVNHPDYWPGFPWWAISANYESVLPMLYWSYRGTGPEWSITYIAGAYEQLARDLGGVWMPVHGIGGIANEVPASDVANFTATSCRYGVVGVSLYDAGTTAADDWAALVNTYRSECS